MTSSFFMRRALPLVAGVLTICAASVALAWTDKPVKMIVPAPAGGTMDIVARLLGDQLSNDIGAPVIVENKPGAGGAIAVQGLLAAPVDGQTIMVTASNVLTEIPHVMKTAFDPLTSVKPVATVVRAGMVLIAGPSVPASDFNGMVAFAKANPGKLSFASYSSGTSSHYAGMILNQKAGLDLQHVPFAGSPPALTQVVGGQIAIMFDGIATSLPQIKAGKVKALGVAAKSRSSHLPDVPTFTELGYPDLDMSNWVGVVVAAGMSNELTDKINAAVNKAAAAPKLRDRLVSAGFEPNAAVSATQLAQSVRADFARNASIVKTFNIQLN